MLKNTPFRYFLFILSFISFQYACTPDDPCADTNCGQLAQMPTGKCVEGTCICNLGFEGALCADPWVLKFKGNYLGNEKLDHTLQTLPKPTKQDSIIFRDTTYQIEPNHAIRMTQKSPTILNISGLANTYSNTFEVPVSKQDSTSIGAYKIICTNLLGVPFTDSYNTKLTMNATYNPIEKSLKGTYTLNFQIGRVTKSIFDYRKQ
jgi:hypothetical protein